MTEQKELLKNIESKLSDLIYINGVIATELIKITENTAAIRHGEDFLNNSPCIPEHTQLNENIINITKKYIQSPKFISILEKHVLKHLQNL